MCVRRADEVVLVDPVNDRVSTGRELASEIDRARRALADNGVRPGDRVGLHLPTSVSLVVAFLAVWELGATYIPLDQLLPDARLNLLIDETGAAVVISNRPNAPTGTLKRAQAITPDVWNDDAGHAPSPVVEVLSGSADCAYIVFTSGSTGHPKGVCATHENLGAFVDSWDCVVDPNEPGVWLASTSFAFDPSVVELIWTLARGAMVVLAPSTGLKHSIGELIELHKVTHFQCTPTRAKVLIDDPFEAKRLGLLKHIIIGGEVLPSSLVTRLYATGIERVTNVYGPTETTVWAFAYEVPRGAGDPISIGYPLPGIKTKIVPINELSGKGSEIGELVIGGPSVSPGYLGGVGPDSPFFVDGDTRWYRSGDMLSENEDGSFDFHGRRDSQVKLNGVRIELGEVESAFESDPHVAQAVAGVLQDELGQDQLACWFVAGPGAPAAHVDLVDLRRRMRLSLPGGLIPAVIAEVEAFPLTPTGKADRRRLAELAHNGDSPQKRVATRAAALAVAPEANAQDTYDSDRARSHFAVCLDVENLGPDSNFFELGGDSLGAAQLANLIHRELGITIPLRAIIEAPTPQAFGAYVEAVRTGRTPADPAAGKVLVRFGPRRNVPQLYLVHGDGGNVLGFRELALRLHDHADVIGVQAIGVEPNCEPDPDLAAMVNRYLDAIRADRAAAGDDSVLLLGGYSGGGKIAVAMAGRWDDRNVGPIALLDAPVSERLAPSKLRRTGSVMLSAWRRGPQSLTQWAQMSARAWTVRFEARAREIEPRFAYVESVVSAATAEAPPPSRVPNGAFVIRVMERNPVFFSDFNWGAVLRTEVPEHWIPGHHLTMFQPPNLDALYEALLAGFADFLA